MGTPMIEEHVVDGIAFFSFKSYEDMVGLNTSDKLHTSLVPIKDEVPGKVSSEYIQNSPATVFKDSSPTSLNGKPSLPLVNGVEPFTVTMPASAMNPSTSSSQINMERCVVKPDMTTAFSNIASLSTSDKLRTSLVSIKDEASEEVPVECIQSSSAAVSKDSKMVTPPNGQLTLPLVNSIEPSTITMPASAMVPCTSSSLINMERCVGKPDMANAFSYIADLCKSQNVPEHSGLNQDIQKLIEKNMNFTNMHTTQGGNAMMINWLLKKLIKTMNELNEEKENGLRLQQDYKKKQNEMENKNAILIKQNISLNTKCCEAAKKINVMEKSLNQNSKSNEMELSHVIDVLKKLSAELNITQKLQDLIKENVKLENQCNEHLENLEKFKAKYLEYKAKSKKFKEQYTCLHLQYSQLEQKKNLQKPLTQKPIMVPIGENNTFYNGGVSNMDVSIRTVSNIITKTYKSTSSKRKDSLLRETVNSEAKKCKLFIDLTSDGDDE